jgi:8-oxo-dGTP pyrophosphatase MutT (NUDIX family)
MNDRPGAHALALTPDQRIILVKLRYARGWRLPGGGRKADESIADGALRELTEEVGLTEHGAVTPLPDIDPSLVMVEGVRFRPARWSLEIEQVIAVAVDELPRDLSPRACQWIEAARSRIIR